MSRGIFYQCDFCKNVALINISKETPNEQVVREFNKLPKGWVKMQVPYWVKGVELALHKVVHLCSVSCATLYLETVESAKEEA